MLELQAQLTEQYLNTQHKQQVANCTSPFRLPSQSAQAPAGTVAVPEYLRLQQLMQQQLTCTCVGRQQTCTQQ
jgi:hypothetical protein